MKPPSNFHEWTMAACAGGTSFGFRTALSHHVLRTKRGGLKRRPCFFLKCTRRSDEYLEYLFLCKFVKVLGGKVDIDNESSKEECQQAPRLASMAIAVMAVSQRFELPREVLCGLKL